MTRAVLAYVAGVVLAILIIAFAAYVAGTRRAVKAYATPTPAEKRIEKRTAEQLEHNAAEADKAEKEIRDAEGDDFLQLARRLLWPE